MEKIDAKYEQLLKALISLDSGLILYKKKQEVYSLDKDNEEDSEGVILGLRDSVIQRFEYCVDILWKYLYAYLQEELKLNSSIVSPRNVIRECARVHLLTEDEVKSFFSMIDSRNLTSHMYKEEVADQVSKDAMKYLSFMKQIILKVKPKDE